MLIGIISEMFLMCQAFLGIKNIMVNKMGKKNSILLTPENITHLSSQYYRSEV